MKLTAASSCIRDGAAAATHHIYSHADSHYIFSGSGAAASTCFHGGEGKEHARVTERFRPEARVLWGQGGTHPSVNA
jgi:hypothetical protein